MITNRKIMDVLGMQEMKMKRHVHHPKSNNKRKGVKVVYISSPMKVKTCASKFRDLVQELTGKDSDAISRFSDFEKSPQLVSHRQQSIGDQYLMVKSESPTFADAVTEPTDHDHDHDVFSSYREGSFLRMFSSSNLLTDSFQLDNHAF